MAACVTWALGGLPPAQAQGMVSGKLLGLREMLDPIVAGAPVVRAGVHIETVILADNGLSVPLSVRVDSPMSERDHVRRVVLLSNRNPRPVIAEFELGPWSGKAEVATRVRLNGSQEVMALVQTSDGHWWRGTAEVEVTESACMDAS